MNAHLDRSRADWVKSSYSNDDGGGCVEWAPAQANAHRLVPVRDSKIPGGPALKISPRAWSSFVTAVRDGGLRP
ncbi:DUF397 domain-containing protein [Streptomyces roseoverticillatus]|uniref:DUF397 domain-containing protein n=1 Tax=Streptomyces roseoverticillatus TaxID=66429 RepID=UPI001F47855C|nr:DUF397 domain-containing protein [Streptomyces roseoverticillatus]MCF3104720.1 DUF397 domain-containing protein [Streptomyces roseoverticillatus]